MPHKQIRRRDRCGACGEQAAQGRGGGPELAHLRRVTASGSSSYGRVSDEELERLYAGARAVIVPNVEEFGIVAVESQAAGRPVLAARGGGALETVVENVTGRFVPPGDVQALSRELRRFDAGDFDADVIQRHAQGFSPTAFRARLQDEIRAAIEETSSFRPN